MTEALAEALYNVAPLAEIDRLVQGVDLQQTLDTRRGHFTALTLAIARRSSAQVVRLLLAYQADPNHSAVPSLATPLTLAVSMRQLEITQILLEAGASVNTYNFGHGNFGPLATAVLEKSEPLVRCLLAWGADVNASTPSGLTCLDQAAGVEAFGLVHCLLDYGARSSRQSTRHKFADVIQRRRRCSQAALCLVGILRFRYRVAAPGFPDGYRMPYALARDMANRVWDTRTDYLLWIEPQALKRAE